ncbi:GH116 family glycosyl hydrolase [Cerasicoccus frondis]|uniref:GH116 family glycosyl hydrolase n=1 Tax=Cerasicoccus frondis TaxID=490090 RepID=UPI002852B10B|nr:GH116 family glycosyl hydrolase [Cerasicoccus frondis]
MSFDSPIVLNGSGVRHLRGRNNIQTALPIGGLGAGCICMNGQGGLQDFAIRNRPATTMLHDHNGFVNDVGFGVIHCKHASNERRTLVVEGPMPPEKVYAFGTQVMGHRRGGIAGLPRFESAEFTGSFPFAQVKLSDDRYPIQATITGWNPFIPSDDKASGTPAAILEYCLTNKSSEPVDYEFSYHLSNLAQIHHAPRDTTSRNEVIPKRGVHFYNTHDTNSEAYGSASLMSLEHEPEIKAMWYRGFWFDSITLLWKELTEGNFQPNDGANAQKCKGWNGGSLLFRGQLQPGESITYPIAITWHFPNGHFHAGYDEATKLPAPPWRTWYSTQWASALEVANYLQENIAQLREDTIRFRNALAHSTLPEVVLDAVSANLAILKSPTLLRQDNGDIWAWEGCGVSYGSCPGSCTHVWNYAQSLPHLFPQLERTLREQEYRHAMDEHGHVVFRFALPSGPTSGHHSYAAADGQLGGLIKLYRDWQICGDRKWLESLYPLAQRSLEYCIRTWDPEERGNLFLPHHNTYDIEFHGPNGMCGSIYIAALSAMAEIANELGDEVTSKRYRAIASRGAKFMREQLFSGEYFIQRADLAQMQSSESKSAGFFQDSSPDDPEYQALLAKEGPKYQYGQGCLSDGVIGAWMAHTASLETTLDHELIQQSLQAIHRYNFRQSLTDHVNPERPGYALGNEGGLVLCSWPKAQRPSLPFVYADEVWTGIEYQVASHLIFEGLVEQGLEIVAATRKRYDGYTRNPWNEYECGSYYARAMASYALLQACTGITYNKVAQSLTISPKFSERPFCSFFAFDGGFGTIALDTDTILVELIRGVIELAQIEITTSARECAIVPVSIKVTPQIPLRMPY